MATISDIKSYTIVDENIIAIVGDTNLTIVTTDFHEVDTVEVVAPASVAFIDIGVVGLGNSGGSGEGAVDSVNGQTGVVTLDLDDIPDGTIDKGFTATEKTKLSGIATGATVNDTDANLKSRANHTGSQAISTVTGLQTALDEKAADADLDAHIANTSNPHSTTKAQVGLSNVDNTSDANKPVSTATQSALDGKAATSHTHTASQVTDFASAVDTRIQNVIGTAPAALDTLGEIADALADDANFAATMTTALAGKSNTGHTHVKADVGLANVDNTSDANKPVSTATQAALDATPAVIRKSAGTWPARTTVTSNSARTVWFIGAAPGPTDAVNDVDVWDEIS